MARTVVISPDGTRGSVPDDQVDKAVAQGYKVVTGAEDHPIKAGVQSAVRALSGGLSDYDAQTDDARAGTKQLIDENPKAAAVGEAAGLVGQAIAAPELGVGEGLATRAIGVGLKSSLAGLGPQISEAALQNRPVNAELLAADMLTAAVTGVALHGAGVGAGKLATAAAGKAGELAASSKIAQAADGMRDRVLKNAYKLDDDVYKFGKSQGLFSAIDHQGVASLAGEAQRKAGASALEHLDNAVTQLPDLAPFREEWAAAAQAPGSDKALKNIAKQVAGVLPKVEDATVGARGKAVTVGDKLKEATDDFIKARQISDAAVSAASPFDAAGAMGNAAPALIFGGPKAGALGVAAQYAGHEIKQRGGVLAARALEKLAEGRVLPRVFEAFKNRVDTMLQTAPGALGPFAQVLAGASAEGADALLAVHSKLANSAQGGDYLARLGMRPESAEEATAYGKKLATLEALEAQRERFDADVEKNARAFFKGDSFDESGTPSRISKGDFDKKLEALQSTLRDPTQLSLKAPSDVRESAPGLMVQGGTQTMQAAQFLVDRAPKPTDLWKPVALRQPFTPAPGDLEKWQRYAVVVENPRQAAIEMVRGRGTAEGVEAMQTLYPNLYASIQAKVLGELQSLKKPLPYAKQAALATIFGPQIMGMNPQQVMLLQTVHQSMAQQQPSQGAEGKGPSQDGRQVVNTGKNMQTQSQRLEARQ